MDKFKRLPTMQDSLKTLIDCGVEINTVLDVGVLEITKPLVDVFPDLTHHLFEPVDLHFEKIRNNYRNIKHVLHNVALSDSDGEVYLACTSIYGTDKVSHSHIVEKEVTKDERPNLVSCKKIRRAKIDTVSQETEFKAPYLLKIDVDGHEIAVLNGAKKVLKDTAIVVIEAPVDKSNLPKLFERANFLMSEGFHLLDIVDLSYYDGILWQVDLIFVRKDIVDKIDRLKPFQAKGFKFDGQKWFALNSGKFN